MLPPHSREQSIGMLLRMERSMPSHGGICQVVEHGRRQRAWGSPHSQCSGMAASTDSDANGKTNVTEALLLGRLMRITAGADDDACGRGHVV